MAGGSDGTGDIATGALWARVAEPHAGEGHGHGDLCLNCGTTLIGAHCHGCGQSAHIHRTMGAIGHEIAHGVFHFEGKIWRTLPMLVLHPGRLTRRYIDGERARFVSPMAAFLFSVFLMFAIVANLPGWHLGGSDLWKPGVAAEMANARTKVAETKAQARIDIDAANARIAQERAKPQPDTAVLAAARASLARAIERRDEADIAESLIGTAKDLPPPAAHPPPSNWFKRKWEETKQNPKLVVYKLKTSAYKFSWVLIPLSLPFLWLLFPFSRRFGFYDHAVFTTYSLTFMSVLTIMLTVLGALGAPSTPLLFAATIIPLLHIYKQIKGTYALSRRNALFRTSVLAILIIGGIIPLFSVLLIYLGVAD